MPAGGISERKVHIVYAVVIAFPEFQPARVIGSIGREQAEKLLNKDQLEPARDHFACFVGNQAPFSPVQ